MNHFRRDAAADEPSDELLCIGCGYDLRSLPVEGACPECGVVIIRSLHGDRLAAADPAWLRRVVMGQRLLTYGVMLLTAAVIAYLLVALGWVALRWTLFSPGTAPASATWISSVLVTLLMLPGVAGVIGVLLLFIGAFPLTAAEPREMLRESVRSERALARWSMSAVMLLGVVTVCTQMIAVLLGPIPVSSILAAAGFLCMFIALWLQMRYVGRLVARIPFKAMEREAALVIKRFGWLVILLTLLLVFGPWLVVR